MERKLSVVVCGSGWRYDKLKTQRIEGGLYLDSELKEKILKILQEMPSECSWLDYKIQPYKNESKPDFVKDICAFLNSTESYGKDKFIIIGIVDGQKFKKGIDQNPMLDDKYYQDWCDYIQPRPHIETGELKDDKGVTFGYIYISKDNLDRVYSIAKDCLEPKVVNLGTENTNLKSKSVYASTAYIRKGSVNYPLNEYDRRRIYEQDAQAKKQNKNEILSYGSPLIDDECKNILKICALFGVWSEKNEAEKKLLSDIIGLEYNEWIKTLRKLLSQKSEYVSFKNNVWKIENKEELIERYAEEYFSTDIENFYEATLKIILEKDPKFELEPSQRVMSNILGKIPIYSKDIKKSVLETFAYCKFINAKFSNCKRELQGKQYILVRDVLKDADWVLYATLNTNLPILAEINEREFLKQLKEFITGEKEEAKRLFEEKEEYVTTLGYTSGIYWALELIAWNPSYLMESLDILAKLEQYDDKVPDVIAQILLTWYPQTKADFALRSASVRMLLQEYGEVGWKALMLLLPRGKTTSGPSYKPKWNNVVNEENMKITTKDLYEQYDVYVNLAIEYAGIDTRRIIDLINIMDDVSKSLFELIENKISSYDIIELNDESKFEIWNELESLIVKHKKFSTTDWALPDEAVKKLCDLSEKIKPNNNEVYLKRLFNQNYWDLFDEKGSYTEQCQRLFKKQVEAITELFLKGIDTVIKFSKTVTDPYRVGQALSEIGITSTDEIKVLDTLNNDDFLFGQGYVNKKVIKKGLDWIDNNILSNLNSDGKVKLLIELPREDKTWKLVTEILKEEEALYWKQVNIRVIEEASDYNYPIRKLIENNRALEALDLIGMALHEKRNFDRELSVRALNLFLKTQEKSKYLDTYVVKKIIKDLQENSYSEDELFKIEWAYLPIFDADDSYRTKTIENKLCNEPQIFNDLVCLAYKAHSAEKNEENPNEKLAINAHRFLDMWKKIPGSDENGNIDTENLNKWFEEMKALAEKTDRVEVSFLTFGKVLYHAPADENGFWINRKVAEILNAEENETIRRGFSSEAFNSVGVVTLDREGTVWINMAKSWEEKAKNTQLEYFRFARMLKDLSTQFLAQAEYEKENYGEW